MSEKSQSWFPLDVNEGDAHHAWGLRVYRNDDQTRGHVAGTIVMLRRGDSNGVVFVPHELMPAKK